MGRYQQTKEQGVKRRTQRTESPKPEPLLDSTQKLARQARKFRRRARVLPNRQRDRMTAPSGPQQKLFAIQAHLITPTKHGSMKKGR